MNQRDKGSKKVNRRARLAVVGVGNVLLKDEGVGVHVVRALAEALGDSRPDVEIVDGGTSPDAFLLLDRVRKLVLVDAATGGGPPGSVYRFRPADIVSAGAQISSAHQMTVLNELVMLRLAGAGPDEVVIIGVEPGEIGWGLELTPALKEKLPQIVKVVMDEITS